jgi:hypothetical protein
MTKPMHDQVSQEELIEMILSCTEPRCVSARDSKGNGAEPEDSNQPCTFPVPGVNPET